MYSKSLSWAENLNKLFTVLGGKFKFSAQDSDLEYSFWQQKNTPVSSDLKPPLEEGTSREILQVLLFLPVTVKIMYKVPCLFCFYPVRRCSV